MLTENGTNRALKILQKYNIPTVDIHGRFLPIVLYLGKEIFNTYWEGVERGKELKVNEFTDILDL